jgi:type IV secretory pathway TraG/TraD family ATPase VirD4
MKCLNHALERCHGWISPNPRIWSAGLPLLRWNGRRAFTVGHSLEHVLAFGASGSGKSSGCIKSMTLGMLNAGYGLLMLSAKTTDPEDFLEWARMAGREKSVVRFGPAHKLGFNLLEYELGRGGTSEDRTMNVAGILGAVGEITARSLHDRQGDRIWQDAAEGLLSHALNLVLLANGKVELDDVVAVVISAPASLTEAGDGAWRRSSICYQRLLAAEARHGTSRMLGLAREYFLQRWARFPGETKNSVVFTFTAMMDLLQRDPVHRLFFGQTDFTPEVLKSGAVMLVEAPTLSEDAQGKVITGLMRLAVERMAKQHPARKGERPIGIIWDEFQTSVTRADSTFAAVARSHGCALVLATQNLPAVQDVIGHDAGRALFANCRTKLFFGNDDPETNQYMADVVGKWPVPKESMSRDYQGHATRTQNPDQDEYAVPPRAALALKTGNKEFGNQVSAVLVQSSRRLKGGKPTMEVLFHQDRPIWRIWSPVIGRTGVQSERRPTPDFRWVA